MKRVVKIRCSGRMLPYSSDWYPRCFVELKCCPTCGDSMTARSTNAAAANQLAAASTAADLNLVVIKATAEEAAAHDALLEKIANMGN